MIRVFLIAVAVGLYIAACNSASFSGKSRSNKETPTSSCHPEVEVCSVPPTDPISPQGQGSCNPAVEACSEQPTQVFTVDPQSPETQKSGDPDSQNPNAQNPNAQNPIAQNPNSPNPTGSEPPQAQTPGSNVGSNPSATPPAGSPQSLPPTPPVGTINTEAKVGFGFEDSENLAGDRDFIDSILCFSGKFNINYATGKVVAISNQAVDLTIKRNSLIPQEITIERKTSGITTRIYHRTNLGRSELDHATVQFQAGDELIVHFHVKYSWANHIVDINVTPPNRAILVEADKCRITGI